MSDRHYIKQQIKELEDRIETRDSLIYLYRQDLYNDRSRRIAGLLAANTKDRKRIGELKT